MGAIDTTNQLRSELLSLTLPNGCKALNENNTEGFSDPAFEQLVSGFIGIMVGTLEGAKKKFIPIPRTLAGTLESEYIFLLEALSDFEADPSHLEANYVIDYFKDSFSEQNIDAIIQYYDEELKEAYIDEEVQRLEAHNQEKQKERTQVINSNHYKKVIPISQKSKPKPSAKKKPTELRTTNRVGGPTQGLRANRKDAFKQSDTSTELKTPNRVDFREQATTYASERIEQIKNPNIRRNTKYRNFLKVVNKMTQEMRKNGVTVTAKLNKSSHGSVTIEHEHVPMYRPHGNFDTAHPKFSKHLLENLVNTYCKTLEMKAALEKK